ncbi:N-alpha-acetyltransferase 30 [Smittium culicis]|uniref:N-alpha-acetyltransferase 30 n=1 Tax=Smittium culicis TaxID=133412 RepID=A0A1R1YMR1_9FUNG|nr:N-alpha-acetyltransferase 30 [Smittium culicis]
MLVVKKQFRNMSIGKKLVQLTIEALRELGADEVVLETEVFNSGALKLYTGLGFIKDKNMARYYLGGTEAFRLKLWLTPQSA